MAPFTGRRLTLNYPNVTQVKPDLWLAVPRGDGTVMIAAVEAEFSAKDDGAISKKLLPYRTSEWAAGEAWPLYVVAGTPEAADRFARLGDDLPLLAAPYGARWPHMALPWSTGAGDTPADPVPSAGLDPTSRPDAGVPGPSQRRWGSGAVPVATKPAPSPEPDRRIGARPPSGPGGVWATPAAAIPGGQPE